MKKLLFYPLTLTVIAFIASTQTLIGSSSPIDRETEQKLAEKIQPGGNFRDNLQKGKQNLINEATFLAAIMDQGYPNDAKMLKAAIEAILNKENDYRLMLVNTISNVKKGHRYSFDPDFNEIVMAGTTDYDSQDSSFYGYDIISSNGITLLEDLTNWANSDESSLDKDTKDAWNKEMKKVGISTD